MSCNLNSTITLTDIDIRKYSFHILGLDRRDSIVGHQKWSCSQGALCPAVTLQ